jgi:hypothetical protein
MTSARSFGSGKRISNFQTSCSNVTAAFEGHLSKILPQNPTKKIGWDTLPLLLGGCGLRLVVIEDPEATKRLLSRSDYAPRREEYVQLRKQVA